MNKFLHSKFFKNPWIILGISIGLFILGLVFRLHGLEQRIWFDSDVTSTLLYAWNIVYFHKPLLVGGVTSGSTMPNSPFFLNFLAILMWIGGSNPVAVISLVTIITTAVVPLLFIWGVVEGLFLSGLIAAILYAIFPGAVELTNPWSPFLALLPCLIGIILFRLGAKRKSNMFRRFGLFMLCLAGITHYSFIGLLASIIIYEFIRLRNIRQALTDIGLSAAVLFLLLFSTFVLMRGNNPKPISITYLDGTCRLCLQKIPILLQSLFSQQFWFTLRASYTQYALYVLAALVSYIVFSIRRKLFVWGVCISILFLLFAWVFAGQTVFWYLSPVILLAYFLFGDILAKGLCDRRIHIQMLSAASLLIFIFISLRSYSEGYYPISKIQNIINTEVVIKNALLPLGISGSQYVEYANLGIFTADGFPDTTALWLVRQWKFHEVITYNDPQHSYDPALINPTPLYRVYVCRGCAQRKNISSWWEYEGYTYDHGVSFDNDLWVYVYKRKE